MAHFRGTVEGNGESSRLGTEKSGITTRANGWGVGITVYGCVHKERDHFEIYATGGSNGGDKSKLVATVYKDGLGKIVIEGPS